MKIGDVFSWDQYPYNVEGKHKKRWFVYLGEYKENPDPLDKDSPVMIIAPTTTAQLHYYNPGEPRAEHPHVRFYPKDGFGFVSECILDLAEADVVVRKTDFQNQEQLGFMEKKGQVTTSRLKEIHKKISNSKGYSWKLKYQIRENMNKIGITGLPKLPKPKRNRGQ